MKSKGRESMGMRKHGRSGRAPKSPKLRHAMKREAERREKKRPPTTTEFNPTVKDVFSE